MQKTQGERSFWDGLKIIFVQDVHQQNRRQRIRNKPLKKRGEMVRTALDLPTTDPGSDLHFSTDDEEFSPRDNLAYGTVAPLRHTLLQSDLQRRYIEEIGDMIVQKPKQIYMPPELIVTTPKSNGPGNVIKLEVYKLTPHTAPERQVGGQPNSQTENLAARRTYSWHNLSHESCQAKTNIFINNSKPALKIQKAPPRRKVPSNFIPAGPRRNQMTDDMQMKLSLNKKIWTGANGEPESRPLGWYRHHQSQGQANDTTVTSTGTRCSGGAQSMTLPLGATTTALPPAYMGAPRNHRKVDQVDLFNACSQKLLLWQQEHKKMQSSHVRLIGSTSLTKLGNSQALMHGCKSKKSIKSAVDDIFHVNVSGTTSKSRRKSCMIKIAETTQLLKRFSRARGNAEGLSATQQQQPQIHRLIKTHHENSAEYAPEHIQQTPHPSAKFKTGGVVVTALQQKAIKNAGANGVSKHIGHGRQLHFKGDSNSAFVDKANMQQNRNIGLVKNKKSSSCISLHTVSFVRKVKTKLKKNKSRTETYTAEVPK